MKKMKNENIATTEGDINDVIRNLNNNLLGFNFYINFINENPNINPHLKNLAEFINLIKDKINGIVKLNKIGKDFSFELVVHVIKEKQSELFSEILNMKNVNDKISETSISIESLENILTGIH